MPGIKALRKLQFGRESTAGTIVPATTVWRGTGALEDAREVTFPPEDIGILSGTDRSYVSFIEGALDLESVPMTFEQLPHILEMGVKTATPTQDGTGSGYIYQYDFPIAAPTIKTYTIEGGDNQQAQVMEYCHAKEFTLEGASKEAWMMSASIVGRQVVNQAFTGSVALPSIEDMLFGKTKLYIDVIGGSWGATLKSNTLLSASLKYTTGIIPKYTADGNLYFSFIQYTQPEVVLDITFEHDGTAVAERAFYESQTARLIRLLIQGSTFAVAGTTYSVKTAIIDLAGKWEKFNPLGEKDGNDIVEATFRARYNSTAAKFGKIIVVPALSALP
ncbi:MAG: hypothetical protein E6Q97_07965 [Desulfurellales bacterium]|jgi:hypothetical protein|nr:MAG: hypothetical protein E6Q97_07965 [Desulfurellales bacterium]